jgi:hypothetical protein
MCVIRQRKRTKQPTSSPDSEFSQVTMFSHLVATSEELFISLRLERDNPCNTTIVDPDGNVFYTVATDFSDPDKPVTRVHDGVGKLVAEWIWRDARSDLLTIRDLPQTPASAWLKKSFIPFREYVLSFFFPVLGFSHPLGDSYAN